MFVIPGSGVHVYTQLSFVSSEQSFKKQKLLLFMAVFHEKLLFIGFPRFQAPPLDLSPWKRHANEIRSDILYKSTS